MDDAILTKKIQALLHDPAEKAIILGRIAHEGRAREIMRWFTKDATITEDVRTADHIASAADRINFPKDDKFVADFLKNPVVIHPLSGQAFDLGSLAQLDIEKILSTVDAAVVALGEKCGDNREVMYLALWRQLLSYLTRKGQDAAGLGQLWELLPADTRIPDHSIWEHKRITSAIAGALPNPALLLFTVGPVQDFIATARKTQDLWSGSYLLSYLSWTAMKVVAEAFGPDSLIFPDLLGQPVVDLWLNDKGLDIESPSPEHLSSPTLPNRFLAIVPQDSAKALADKAKSEVQKTFQTMCQAVKTTMEEKLAIKSEHWDAIWHRQTEEFIETYWVSTTLPGYTQFLERYKALVGVDAAWKFGALLKEYEERGFAPNVGTLYGLAYRLTEKALGSRKLARSFSFREEPNHKCTLCGVREPVHPKQYNNQDCSRDFGALRAFWQEKVLPDFPQIRKSERLCAVCVTKRFAASHFFRGKLDFKIDSTFPSVSIIATASFKEKVIQKLDRPDVHVRVSKFIDSLTELFRGAEERIKGESLPMVRRMCKNKESVSDQNRELATKLAALEGEWLFVDSLTESLKEEVPHYSPENLNATKSSLRDLYRILEKAGIGEPSRYYAVLLMDGDNMGKWLSGEHAPPIGDILHPSIRNSLAGDWQNLKVLGRPLSPSLHLATSRALRDFSLTVAREIVEKDHLGKLVYAGGDDVLAFVSLRDLPEVMRKLRAYFSGSLKIGGNRNVVEIDFGNGSGFVPLDNEGRPINVGASVPVRGLALSMGTKASASMGVVIAHYSQNLAQVLEEVRACEKTAKRGEKNAFCVALAKRAGGTEHVTAKWHYEKDCYESMPLLRSWADAFYNEQMSPKFVYTFKTETTGLDGDALPLEAKRYEILRLANRHTKATKVSEPIDVNALVDGILKLHSGGMSLKEIAVFLSVAAFLGREENR